LSFNILIIIYNDTKILWKLRNGFLVKIHQLAIDLSICVPIFRTVHEWKMKKYVHIKLTSQIVFRKKKRFSFKSHLYKLICINRNQWVHTYYIVSIIHKARLLISGHRLSHFWVPNFTKQYVYKYLFNIDILELLFWEIPG